MGPNRLEWAASETGPQKNPTLSNPNMDSHELIHLKIPARGGHQKTLRARMCRVMDQDSFGPMGLAQAGNWILHGQATGSYIDRRLDTA